MSIICPGVQRRGRVGQTDGGLMSLLTNKPLLIVLGIVLGFLAGGASIAASKIHAGPAQGVQHVRR